MTDRTGQRRTGQTGWDKQGKTERNRIRQDEEKETEGPTDSRINKERDRVIDKATSRCIKT